jgi:hypothetical protein
MERKTNQKTRIIGYGWYEFIFHFDNSNPYKLEVFEKHSNPSKGIFNERLSLGGINLLDDKYAKSINLELLLQEHTENFVKFLNYALHKFGRSQFNEEHLNN